MIKKKWTSNNKIIYPKSERPLKSKNKALYTDAICSKNSSFKNIKMSNISLKSLLYSRWIISPKSVFSRQTISEKFLTVPAPISVSSPHKWNTKVQDKTHKEIDKSSKHKTHSILNLFANRSKKELIKVSQYKIPSEILHLLSLKEVNGHMQAFCPLFINKMMIWRVKAKKKSAVIVKDQNAWNFIVNASRKRYSVPKAVIVMTVEIINKISLNINKPLLKRWVETHMVLMMNSLTKNKNNKWLNKKT